MLAVAARGTLTAVALPLVLGELRDKEPCRGDLRTKFPMATAPPEVCLQVGEAAMALARRAAGVAIDTYGFPVDRPEDLLRPQRVSARTNDVEALKARGRLGWPGTGSG